MSNNEILNFAFPKNAVPIIIKVVGVGGGGGNAVSHMFKQGIYDVSFALCNTDSQALKDSPIPVKVQIGEGLGAGNKPEKAKIAAEESIEEIHQMLNDGTKMVFITAGMGGGTGTGAAPIIAKAAKEMGILTVGIVTIPFMFEGKRKILKALDGVKEMSKYVDALLVVNNERLKEIYSDLSAPNAFAKADDTLAIAAKGIAEIITKTGIINLDFADVYSTLKDGGIAIMSTGYGEGEDRVAQAIENALNSPLLNNNDVYNSKRLLFNIYYGDNELMVYELDEFDEFTSQFDSNVVDVIWGMAQDKELGNSVKVTVLASGFDLSNMEIEDLSKGPQKKHIIYPRKSENNNGTNEEMINKWYPKSSEPLILTAEQLMSDDEMITEMEEVPAFLRNAKTAVRSVYKSKSTKRPSRPASPNKGQDDGVIRF